MTVQEKIDDLKRQKTTHLTEELDRLGWARYAEIRSELEAQHHGNYVMIEVDSGDYFVGKTPREALHQAQASKLLISKEQGTLKGKRERSMEHYTISRSGCLDVSTGLYPGQHRPPRVAVFAWARPALPATCFITPFGSSIPTELGERRRFVAGSAVKQNARRASEWCLNSIKTSLEQISINTKIRTFQIYLNPRNLQLYDLARVTGTPCDRGIALISKFQLYL
ncbi:MAG: hypothetical protein ACE5JU_19465 [Candidatus Binatia bacterium]